MHKRKYYTIIEIRLNISRRPLSETAEFVIIIVNYNEHPLTPQEKRLRNTKEKNREIKPNLTLSLPFSPCLSNLV